MKLREKELKIKRSWMKVEGFKNNLRINFNFLLPLMESIT